MLNRQLSAALVDMAIVIIQLIIRIEEVFESIFTAISELLSSLELPRYITSFFPRQAFFHLDMLVWTSCGLINLLLSTDSKQFKMNLVETFINFYGNLIFRIKII